MIHHIGRLHYDRLVTQIETARNVVTSHVNWLASRSIRLNVDELRTYSTYVPFDEWYASLAQIGLAQTEEYRKLGELRDRMMAYHATMEEAGQNGAWAQRFFLLHQHFFDLLIEICQTFHKVFHMYDGLTRMPSRKLFDLMVDKGRMKGSLVMADVDHFKHINDGHGHETGDQVLEQVGRLFVQSLEPGEVVARYGGEEFIFYFPNQTPEALWDKVEQLRQRIQTVDVNGLHLTCSFGISLVDVDKVPFKQALCRADNALYQAKSRGRNCTVMYSFGCGNQSA